MYLLVRHFKGNLSHGGGVGTYWQYFSMGQLDLHMWSGAGKPNLKLESLIDN